MNSYLERSLESAIQSQLERGKSIILLGPRQTGKTTLLNHCLQADFKYNFIIPSHRLKFEQRPDDLIDIVNGFHAFNTEKKIPLVYIDEIQKVPAMMDVIQYLIDEKKSQFVLTGSSARKLKYGQDHALNLLPGRLIYLQMDALSIEEWPSPLKELDFYLINGSLPGIYFLAEQSNIDLDLRTYVEIYLEEEVRQEGIVRHLQSFGRFLELSALSMGDPINFTAMGQQLGISPHQIIEYFQILEDCMIVYRIDALYSCQTRRRLTKAPKFLYFDLGVRRLAAKEGIQLTQRDKGWLFEQFIGIELIKLLHQRLSSAKLKYWRDHNGPEVDYVIEDHHRFLPIEVKWTDNPQKNDARHLLKFLAEYPVYRFGYIICRCQEIRQIHENVIALPWQGLAHVLDELN